MRIISKKSLVQLFANLAWLLFILVGYYIYHKPLDPGLLPAPLSAGLDIVCAFLIFLTIGGIGRKILPASTLHPLERFSLQAAVGIGVTSLGWLLLGVLHLYYAWMPFLMLLWFVNWKISWAWLKELTSLIDIWQRSKLLEKLLAIIASLLTGNQILLALSPPVSWDSLVYHLQLPRLYLVQRSIQLISNSPYWGHPQEGEMLYTWASSFFRAETAAVLGWMVGIVLLAGILGFTIHHSTGIIPENEASLQPDPSVSAGWVAVAALLCSVTFRLMFSWSYTDLFTALMGLAVFISVFAWLDNCENKWILWAGVFTGLALSAKSTAGIIAPALFVFIFLYCKKTSHQLKYVGLSALLALLVFLPWLVKDWIATGNPLYPYFLPNQWSAISRSSTIFAASPASNWLDQIILPISFTWRGVQGGEPFDADPGPLLLLFSLPGLWVFRRQPKAHFVILCLVFGWIGVSIGGLFDESLRQPRLYFVLLPGVALACAWGWATLQSLNLSGVRLRRVFGAVVLLVIGMGFWQDMGFTSRLNPLAVLAGIQTREQYLDNTLGWYSPAMRALNALPPGSRSLMLWETRGFYAPLNAIPDYFLVRWHKDYLSLGSPANILSAWKRQGFTNLLFYKTGADLLRQKTGLLNGEDWNTLDQLLALLPKPQSFGDVYLLYSLTP